MILLNGISLNIKYTVRQYTKPLWNNKRRLYPSKTGFHSLIDFSPKFSPDSMAGSAATPDPSSMLCRDMHALVDVRLLDKVRNILDEKRPIIA